MKHCWVDITLDTSTVHAKKSILGYQQLTEVNWSAVGEHSQLSRHRTNENH
jgi:hypothetical protein